MALAPDGTIFAGWSTLDQALWAAGTQNYYDAHFLASVDGGLTWIGQNGPVALPVSADDTGAAFEIVNTSDPTEFTPFGSAAYQGNWNLLQGFAYNRGELQFVYGGPQPQPHNSYARMNWSTRSFDTRMSPYFTSIDGQTTFAGGGGSFAQDPTAIGPLYFVGGYYNSGSPRLAIVSSDDGGSSWYQMARSDRWTGAASYINTARNLTPDGSVVGSFTYTDSAGTGAYFFRSAVR